MLAVAAIAMGGACSQGDAGPDGGGAGGAAGGFGGGRAGAGGGSGGGGEAGGGAAGARGGASGAPAAGGSGGRAGGGGGHVAGSGGTAGSPGGGGAGGGLAACGALTTSAGCDARSDCHAVFVDPGTCGCASSGCCAHFSRCADGGRANCSPAGVQCDALTPHCEPPYVVGYANGCYEGCVRATACMPGACPAAPPTAGGACVPVDACLYEDCGGAGRTVARCPNGLWTVETGPCGTFSCANGIETCAAGQICVRQEGGAQLVRCAANNCGTGPINCNCLQSCNGDCTITGSIDGGVEVRCNTCPSKQCA